MKLTEHGHSWIVVHGGCALFQKDSETGMQIDSLSG